MTQSQEQTPIPAPLSRSAGVLMLFVGLSVSLGNFALPGLVGIFEDGYGFTLAQSGFLATAFMAGGGVGAIGLTLLVFRVRTLWLLMGTLAIVACGYLIVAFAQSFTTVFAAMSFAGFGEGAALALTTCTLSRAGAPDRMYGIFIFLAISTGAISFSAIPILTDGIGVRALFFVFALVPAFALLFARIVPDLLSTSVAAKPAVDASLRVPAQRVVFIVGLTAALFIYTAKGGFWTYLDRIGVGMGLDVAIVSRTLALGSVVGAAGAAFAAFLNSRWGRAGPILFCLLVQSVALTGVVHATTAGEFAAGVVAFYFVWYFFIANLLGLMSAADRSGRLVSALLAAQTIGLAIGPAVSALVVSDKDFTVLAPLGVTAYALAAMLLAPVLRAARSRRVTS